MTVRVDNLPAFPDLREAWEIYKVCFDPLRPLAVQRHHAYWDEFTAAHEDRRVEKHVATIEHNGITRTVGLGVVTNKLTAWPLISPEYFAEHWPAQYETDRIWYVGFVGVPPEGHQTTAFRAILESMTEGRRGTGDLFFMDFCDYNENYRQIARVVLRILQRIHPGATMRVVDRQSFWCAEFPA